MTRLDVLLLALVCLVFFILGLWWNKGGGPNDQPVLIHEVSGCKVYRFKDLGDIHYYVNCPERSATTYKNGLLTVSIITEYNPD